MTADPRGEEREELESPPPTRVGGEVVREKVPARSQINGFFAAAATVCQSADVNADSSRPLATS